MTQQAKRQRGNTSLVRRLIRAFLVIAVPLMVLLLATYIYVVSGRVITTENAYVKASNVQIAPEGAGRIVQVLVNENTPVAEGDLLFLIDPTPYQLAVNRAQARLEEARSSFFTLKASYRQMLEELALAKVDADYAQREYQRQKQLAEQRLASASDVDRVRHALDRAKQQLVVIEQELARLRASLDDDPNKPVTEHPSYRVALGALKQAERDLANTRVTSPIQGVATHVPERGSFVRTGQVVMSVVATQSVWVEANLKETEVTHVLPGQSVTMVVDTYPDRVWQGHVDSVAQATGAEFALLPPQNASGNWVKVVQRIPVRIAVEPKEDAPPLRSGMSVSVEIETGYQTTDGGMLASVITWARGWMTGAQAQTE